MIPEWVWFIWDLIIVLVLIELGVFTFKRFVRRPARDKEITAKGKEIVTFEAKVWRGKGGLYPDYTDPKTGEMIPWPGGQWRDGREGHIWDKGVIARRVDEPRKWRWLWLRMRIELQGIKLFVLAMFKRRL